jgi:hypothetical protein
MTIDPSAPLQETWPEPAAPVAEALLQLDSPPEPGEDPIAHDVSAAAAVGETLFVAADEAAYVEVLHRAGPNLLADHERVSLASMFDLPDGAEEMDIEGLAAEDGWLWIVGSHSVTRRKPKAGRPFDAAAIERFARLKDNRNRMFLGRAPLVRAPGDGERYAIDAEGRPGRRPQMSPIGRHGSRLMRLLRKDPHLAPFLKIPAKENGLDIEGLVVSGERVGLGLRGPVLNGWACLLELTFAEGSSRKLKVASLSKHWLDLGGLGIRDLKRRGDDVLILAGPTMALDGPVQIYRWQGWATGALDPNQLHRPERVMDLPYGKDCDHPEALAPWTHEGKPGLLVVCDSPARRRLNGGAIIADVFELA